MFDNGHEKSYVYDDQGERVIKRGPQGETAYVNQWFTVRNRSVATKHVWAGTTRIASSLVPGVKVAGGSTSNGNVNANNNGRGNGRSNGNGNSNSRNQSNFLSYYHPDHLGSNSYVTDANGKVTEHLEYFAFGETWVEENSNTQRTPYLFTAKELDEETGLYYFGARYYDPRTSVWQSPDPILHLYIDGGGNNGIYRSGNLGLYSYSYQNPIVFTDPDGNLPIPLITGVIGSAVSTVAYAGRQLYVGEAMTWQGAGTAAGAGFLFGSGAVFVPSATAVAGAAVTGYATGDLLRRAPDYANMSAKDKRAFQADAALTLLGVAATAVQGTRATAKGITKGEQVTEKVIRNVMKDAPLTSQQKGGVSLPRVQQYVDKLLSGEVAPAIKVDGNLIVDGNHRYIAGRILGREPTIQPWAGGRPTNAVSWDKLPINPEAW